MLDFRFNTFLTLCKVRNYTKTAEILHITQPAVSQHIKYLEESYGVKLFNFSGKILNLTEAGKILYDFALAMQSSSDRVKSMVTGSAKINQPITFATTLTIGEYIMPNLLINLVADFPKTHLTMYVGNTKSLLEKLRDGKIDFAILEGHFDKSNYNSFLFSLESFIGVCSANHAFADAKLSFKDIFNERLILREKGSGTREIFEQILYEHNTTMKNFKHIMEVGNISVIKEMVSKNLGITFLYKEAVKDELANGILKQINISDLDVDREFNFVFLKDSLHYKEYEEWFNYFMKKRSQN